jgi:hypothetical protein
MGQDVGDRVKERNRPSKQKSNGGMKWAEALHHGDGHRGSDEDWLRLVVPDASCLRRCRRRVLTSCIEPTRPPPASVHLARRESWLRASSADEKSGSSAAIAATAGSGSVRLRSRSVRELLRRCQVSN